jgi:2-polyprenyl-6-methoxyphenol hydroxylase-like FAD-dependent oxidoreductase
VLVGDAAWCVSLLAGQGASLALAGADRLASALPREPADVRAALCAWEAQLRTPVEQRQAAGRRTAAWFVPADRLHLLVRDLSLRVATWPVLSRLLRRRLLTSA